jgi:uncharacterized membrane protein
VADFWLLVVLGGAIVFLWRRVDRLEAQLRELTWREGPAAGAAAPRIPAAPPELPPESTAEPGPAHPATSGEPAAFAPSASSAAGAMARRFAIRFDFEDLFGRLLPIWAGGVALAVAGFFLVRWSIEAGLLTVSVRVILGFLFGLSLLVAAEAAYRMERRVADPRVRQALAGAGIATLYASFYLAGSFYGLIGTGLAFVGLATVTAGAIALSFRFGLPSAVLGLVGGFAAPALVGGDEANLPVLTLYLALVAAGLTFTGRRQDRAWLGITSLAGGLGWGALLGLAGAGSEIGIAALGAYLVILGAVLPAFTARGRPGPWVRVGAAAIAALQLAALVHQGGYGALEWSLYLLLGAALAWFGWRFPTMREANAVAAAVAFMLLGLWPDPTAAGFLAVAAALAAIFAGVPLAQLWRAEWRRLDVAQACGAALGLAAVTYGQFGDFAAGRSEPLLAAAIAALAGAPALAAWLVWPRPGERWSRSALAATACAAALAGTAGLVATPAWAAPLIAALVVAGTLRLERGRSEAGLLAIARATVIVGLLLLVVLPQVAGLLGDEAARIVGYPPADAALDWRSPVRWLAAAAAFVPLMRRESDRTWRATAETLGALVGYGAAAQVVPTAVLPWALALGGLALAWRLPDRRSAVAAVTVLASLWAVPPLGAWTLAGFDSLAGFAPAVDEWPTLREALLRLVPLAVLGAGVLAFDAPRTAPLRNAAWAATGAIVLIAAHTLYRHGFAAIAGTDFVTLGMAERTGWEFVLLAGALVAVRVAGNGPARSWLTVGFAGVALAHFVWFTLGVHNPLWSAQAVGPGPVANWLLPAYIAGAGALVLLRRIAPALYLPLRWLGDAALMMLIVLLALSELRQVFSGSLLTAVPMSQTEDLLRSVLGIVVAIGFLLWGARSRIRSWRLGSLAVMLLAVLKVFLFDAAGLEGLARIASFMALGFSLIGIGWFYARQLKAPARDVA